MSQSKPKPKLMVENVSCILPQQTNTGGLFVGNVYGAQNPAILKEYGIRAVLTSSIQTDINYKPTDIPFHMKIQAHDKQNYNIREHINQCIHFIEEARKYTNVFVHCYAGVSRSVAIVSAYIMWKFKWNYETTIAFMKAKRIVSKPNDGFVRQLIQIEQIIIETSYRASQKSISINQAQSNCQNNQQSKIINKQKQQQQQQIKNNQPSSSTQNYQSRQSSFYVNDRLTSPKTSSKLTIMQNLQKMSISSSANPYQIINNNNNNNNNRQKQKQKQRPSTTNYYNSPALQKLHGAEKQHKIITNTNHASNLNAVSYSNYSVSNNNNNSHVNANAYNNEKPKAISRIEYYKTGPSSHTNQFAPLNYFHSPRSSGNVTSVTQNEFQSPKNTSINLPRKDEKKDERILELGRKKSPNSHNKIPVPKVLQNPYNSKAKQQYSQTQNMSKTYTGQQFNPPSNKTLQSSFSSPFYNNNYQSVSNNFYKQPQKQLQSSSFSTQNIYQQKFDFRKVDSVNNSNNNINKNNQQVKGSSRVLIRPKDLPGYKNY